VFLNEGEKREQDTSQQLMPFASTRFALARNWILQLRSNKNKIQQQTEQGATFENRTFQYQANHKMKSVNKYRKGLFSR
jgi:hypothetical protein